jgi:VanZ family protein
MTTNGSPTIDHKTACTWLLVAAWTALILWAGSGSYSAANTSRFLLPLVRWLLPDALFQTHWQLMIFARKAAHVVEYAVLAWLCWLALRATLHNALLRIAGLALIWVIAVASFDEIRQSTLASRSGSGFDVALDVFGGVLALTLAIAYTRRMRRKREPVAGG